MPGMQMYSLAQCHYISILCLIGEVLLMDIIKHLLMEKYKQPDAGSGKGDILLQKCTCSV